MPVVASKTAARFEEHDGVWRFDGWASRVVAAGTADRRLSAPDLLATLRPAVGVVEAEQVHGSSIAIVERAGTAGQPIAGCDALATVVPGLALVIRTADCLPLFFSDPSRGVVGIAHVGWRGLAASLPLRFIAALRHASHSRPDDLHVAIGPSIRACCYEVGPGFVERFGPFIEERAGRRTCDLVAAAIAQLQQGGVRRDRIVDSRRCTACEPQHWCSLRRDGEATGRLLSFVMIPQPNASPKAIAPPSGGAVPLRGTALGCGMIRR